MRTETEHTVYLKDYAPSAYLIDKVELDVRFAPDRTRVLAVLWVRPHADTAPGTPLVLNGDGLTLGTIALDGAPLPVAAYAADDDGLTVFSPPARPFALETEVALAPEKNTRLMGLYRSSGTWCTQCEPEGFRRITYFLDRPDVLATYSVRMEADKAIAPVLLANGNLVDRGDLADGRHFARWDDPFPKPSYLFAMVAGDLGSIHDSFTTASGRKVALGIYCEHGNEQRCLYAMDSLKRSMAWDERRFGREYDLDIFNIVAVSDFNFGAMENKGLNIFNDKLVFAQPDTATDADYANIERVIAHEYFHNWTGDRITCRDWFQLCLKEGLTVYRDQEFSSDERSRAVQRIENVRNLRAIQFPEDGGPLAHPARPDNYREINNFYTATVYEKGAEIVRMIATLLGTERFRKGMDLYFERHDGEATTIEAFVESFEDANQMDLSAMLSWYLQAGTPRLTIEDSYDEATGTYTLDLHQETPPTPGQPSKQPQVIPITFALIGPNGSEMGWTSASGAEVEDGMIVLRDESATVTFSGIPSRPVPSLLRGFSAPVILQTPLSEADRLFLARHDADPFNRWQALQDIAMDLMVRATRGEAWSDAQIGGLAAALEETLGSPHLDEAFKAHALALPGEMEVARTLGANVDPDRIHEVRVALVRELVERLGGALREAYGSGASGAPYSPDAQQAGARALRNTALGLLVRGSSEGEALASAQYRTATNMTDRLAALGAAVAAATPDSEAMMGDFRTLYTADPLVFDKWLGLTATSPHAGTIDRIRAVLADPAFPINNPNRLRALVGGFANGNPVQFARPDGAGFRLVTDFVADADRRNPQVAARVLTAFRLFRTYETGRRAQAESALKALADQGGLSRNTSDILTRTLEG